MLSMGRHQIATRAKGLERFVEAQEPIYADVVAELKQGRKASHWMWFVFPQLRCLGQSEKALFYGLSGSGEARAYATHDVLGARLRGSTNAVMAHVGTDADLIFGYVDALKLRSCMTLFQAVTGEMHFSDVIASFYDGKACEATLDALAGGE